MGEQRLRFFLVVLTGVMVTTLTGCSGFGPRSAPDWVHGMSQEYPADQYLLGLGQGESQEVAEERAYAGVAKIFKAEVTAQSRDWESFLLLENRGSSKTERRLTLDQITRVSTDKVLENVRILDRWQDRNTNQSYALAGMHRGHAAVALLERIVMLDRAIDSAITEAHRTQDGLSKIRHMRRAIKDLLLREAYNADLRVIRASGQGSPPLYRVAELTSELEHFLAAHLIVGVEITGDQAEPVRRALLEGLIREGLPATAEEVGAGTKSGGSPRDSVTELLVKGTVRLWHLDARDLRFRFVRWCSDFVILEVGTQRVVGAVSRNGREGHLSRSEAMARAVRVMQQELTTELAKTLAGYVYGEADKPEGSRAAACPRTMHSADRPNNSTSLVPLL
ncbi:MAG: LPP20 family lipoprotein [Nitrospiraceae bacterium]